MIFIKTISKLFYQAHAGFFLLVIFLCFGFMGANEHKAIATSIALSPTLCFLILIPWLSYVIYSSFYFIRLLATPSFRIFRIISLSPVLSQTVQLAGTFLMINLPVLLYSWFVAYYSITLGSHTVTITIVLFLFLATLLPVAVLLNLLKGPAPESKSSGITTLWNHRFIKPFSIWIFQHLLSHPLVLLITKVCSIATIIFTSILFSTDDYDWRLAALSMIAVVGIHLVLLQIYVKFFYVILKFARNMPRSCTQIGVSHGIALLLLMTPEFIIMLRYYTGILATYQVLITFTYGLSLLYLLVMLLVHMPNDSDKSIRRIFFLLIGLIVIIMYSIPLIWVTMFILLIGVGIQSKEYSSSSEYV